ncbi:MAG: hypothetical protein A3E81_03215 [Gammaproteobacteria bacterium RIFCSPHIGHO2_12_FULL_36_30]|nr:MAG: hypothetical protein A3E81_03215 [Gammaproteobacteria bacterium RIFCSPHIGHO2_12_FULL_36_30]
MYLLLLLIFLGLLGFEAFRTMVVYCVITIFILLIISVGIYWLYHSGNLLLCLGYLVLSAICFFVTIGLIKLLQPIVTDLIELKTLNFKPIALFLTHIKKFNKTLIYLFLQRKI